MANDDWWDYVLERAAGAQQSEIAKAFGVNQTTVSNWKNAVEAALSVGVVDGDEWCEVAWRRGRRGQRR